MILVKPIKRYFKGIASVGKGNYIYYWQSKGFSDERMNSLTTSNYYHGTKARVDFNGNCLK